MILELTVIFTMMNTPLLLAKPELQTCEEVQIKNMAYLSFLKGVQEERCSGFRYDKHSVISAAHCVFHDGRVLDPSRISISFCNLLESLNHNTTVHHVEVFKDYLENTPDYDIALIRINTTFPFSPLTPCSSEKDSVQVYMMGYMRCSSLDPEEVSIEPLIKTGRIIEPEKCNYPESVFCLQPTGNQTSCPGDSGGPVFNGTGFLIGVISGRNGDQGSIVISHTSYLQKEPTENTYYKFYIIGFIIFVLLCISELIFYLFRRAVVKQPNIVKIEEGDKESEEDHNVLIECDPRETKSETVI